MRTVGLVFKKEKSVKNEKTDDKSGLGDENAKVQE